MGVQMLLFLVLVFHDIIAKLSYLQMCVDNKCKTIAELGIKRCPAVNGAECAGRGVLGPFMFLCCHFFTSTFVFNNVIGLYTRHVLYLLCNSQPVNVS